ncbi:hypothetical protein PX699_16705 [Sphingobium sp. H39-3-25]|uniref:hypothetical protein n=1 Tax=Sphingomonadales TaxID=204457 RepID=UPI0008342926|nr:MULTISPECIES: hypothetical protein [Sphingomonadaceae]MDF0491571.1 hypothetical protein [Sphingomonas pollutisoli]MDF0543994.1 hypothetical protein [Sphingobium arseniciresistens]
MPDRIRQLLVETFNADLAALLSTARVALPSIEGHDGVLELQNEEGEFLDFIPDSASPEMVAITYRLYRRGFSGGLRAGEEAAWVKLRRLIGAAAAHGGPHG